jgi:hypothetical protein
MGDVANAKGSARELFFCFYLSPYQLNQAEYPRPAILLQTTNERKEEKLRGLTSFNGASLALLSVAIGGGLLYRMSGWPSARSGPLLDDDERAGSNWIVEPACRTAAIESNR